MKPTPFFLHLFGLLVLCLAGCASPARPAQTPTPSVQEAVSRLHWFGTSAFLYHGSKVIYFDPITLAGTLPPADLVLVTHAHPDHWSPADIKKIIGPNTTLIIGPNVSNSYEVSKSNLGIPATVLSEGQTTEVNSVSIQAVPAYDTAGHPKGSGGFGFLVKVDGITFYHSGGTAAYPDIAKYNCDIAFVPVYSMDQAQAMAEIIPARVIILEHTSYYAAKAVADLFAKSLSGGKTFIAMLAGPNSP